MVLPDGNQLFIMGSSHRCASLEVRERLALDPENLDCAYRTIGALDGLCELLLISTCNRVEIYGLGSVAIDHRTLAAHMAEFWNLPVDDVLQSSYWYTGRDAVQHLFEVSSGLDSAMVGETEIFGQVKAAYAAAAKRKTLGPVLNRTFQKSFQVAKWVRTHTTIGKGQISIGNVAAELAARICGELSGTHVLLCGTGEVGEKTLQALVSRGADDIAVASRSRDRARELADRYHGVALTIEESLDRLQRVDIVISATVSQQPVIGENLIRTLMRHRPARPLFLIDLAVPRNIASQCAQIANVYLYNIDDLSQIANENLASRMAGIDSCRAILRARADAVWDRLKLQPRTDPAPAPHPSLKHCAEAND